MNADPRDVAEMQRRIDVAHDALNDLRREHEALKLGANAQREELIEARKSLRFLRNLVGELAGELGLAVENIGGIVAAVKARDGSGKLAKERLEFVERLKRQVADAEKSADASRRILRRISTTVGARADETVESAVERVCESFRTWDASSLEWKAMALAIRSGHAPLARIAEMIGVDPEVSGPLRLVSALAMEKIEDKIRDRWADEAVNGAKVGVAGVARGRPEDHHHHIDLGTVDLRTRPGAPVSFGYPPTPLVEVEGNVVHHSVVPFRAVCGASVPNQTTAMDIRKVTCKTCLRVDALPDADLPGDGPAYDSEGRRKE